MTPTRIWGSIIWNGIGLLKKHWCKRFVHCAKENEFWITRHALVNFLSWTAGKADRYLIRILQPSQTVARNFYLPGFTVLLRWKTLTPRSDYRNVSSPVIIHSWEKCIASPISVIFVFLRLTPEYSHNTTLQGAVMSAAFAGAHCVESLAAAACGCR